MHDHAMHENRAAMCGRCIAETILMNTKEKIGVMCLAIGVIACPAQAKVEDRAGSVQVKAFATGVVPDGKITRVDIDLVGLPADTQTEANDNYVPTIAIEYFVTENFSLETICCLTQHDVDGTTGLPGAELVSNAKLIPATMTLKYHFDAGALKPYIGVGPSYFLWIDDEPGAATIPLGVTDFKLSDELGFALQAGADMKLNESGLAFSIDAKRYFIDTTARWFAGTAVAIQTKHKLDPWVVSAGLAYSF
jgi:outer membrane protein